MTTIPKWVCTECGYVHKVVCKPGCSNFVRFGTCCPDKCPGCGAPRTSMSHGAV